MLGARAASARSLPMQPLKPLKQRMLPSSPGLCSSSRGNGAAEAGEGGQRCQGMGEAVISFVRKSINQRVWHSFGISSHSDIPAGSSAGSWGLCSATEVGIQKIPKNSNQMIPDPISHLPPQKYRWDQPGLQLKACSFPEGAVLRSQMCPQQPSSVIPLLVVKVGWEVGWRDGWGVGWKCLYFLLQADPPKTKVDGFDFSLYLAAVVSFMSQHFRPFQTQHSW